MPARIAEAGGGVKGDVAVSYGPPRPSVRVRRAADAGPGWEALNRVQVDPVYSSHPPSSAGRGRAARHGRPG